MDRWANRLVVFVLLSFFCCRRAVGLVAPSADIETVREQLGYVPSNFHSVSARTENGSPIAILTYPLHGGAPRRQRKAFRETERDLGTPFPTLYWLTNPEISVAIAELERDGYVRMLKSTLDEDPVALNQFLECHKDYAKRRWDMIAKTDQEHLMSDDPSMKRIRYMMQSSGVAGIDYVAQINDEGTFEASLKCLHAHYAHYRSVAVSPQDLGFNPVGHRVHELLQSKFPNLCL